MQDKNKEDKPQNPPAITVTLCYYMFKLTFAEGLMTMPKKKNSPYLKRKTNDQPNKKRIIWISSIFAAIVIIMAVLLILGS
ncbi:hypothetical protein ACVLD2_001303 [Paenibacillus sp. PvR052]